MAAWAGIVVGVVLAVAFAPLALALGLLVLVGVVVYLLAWGLYAATRLLLTALALPFAALGGKRRE